VFVAFPFADLMASMIGFVPLGTGAVRTTVDAELKRGYLHSKDFGATGNGTTDDTAALQAWLNACSSLGIPGFLDGGSYLISSALTVTNSNGISVFGPEASPGNAAEAKIVMGSLTQDGIQFNTTGRVCLKGFGVVSSGTPTAGAALNFQGSASQSVGGFVERVDLGFGNTVGSVWNGIVATGFAAFTINECSMTAQNCCINVSNPGDSEITNCRLTPVSASAGGVFVQGDAGGIRILSNKFNSGIAYLFGISVTVGAGVADADVFIIGNSIEGVYANGYGITINQQGGATFGNILVVGNEISCPGAGSWGIYFANTTPHWLNGVVISSNVILSYQGVYLGAMDNWAFIGNVVTGSSSCTLAIEANCTLGLVVGNVLPAMTDVSMGTVKGNNQGVANTPTLLATLGIGNNQPLNVANLQFAGFSSLYDNYMLVFEGVIPSANGVSFELLQRDGGSFQSSGYSNLSGSSATNYIDLLNGGTANNNSTSGYGISGIIYVHSINQSGIVKVWEGSLYSVTNAPAITQAKVGGARITTNNPVTGFQVQFSSGNIATGQIKVYGLP
jgi:hypothetical protein